MIELRTGVPGSGKTLSMVVTLSRLFKRWESSPEEARPVFVLGIPDLAFPVSEVPLKSVQIHKAGSPSLVPDWDAMPDGSLVLIDEAQGVFPPRSTASVAPVHVLWLNTHRHHGFDIWLTTQHPKLIDNSVRALVGKHQHYRRLFGGSRAIVYEWDSCSDNLGGIKTAVTTYWSFPKKSFKCYKSAEVHTKQQFKYPKWLFIPVVGLLMALFFVPRAYSVMFGEKKTAADYVQADSSKKMEQPMNGASVAALAATESPLSGFPVPPDDSGNGSTVGISSQSDMQQARPVAQFKLAENVYTDDATLPQHFTDQQMERQRQSVAVLDYHERLGRYVPSPGREPDND